ncbi:MAG TPA: transporter [Gemmatimonadaceae bacterium]|nr:transporter [Gemmatimonadaceae bacterium]
MRRVSVLIPVLFAGSALPAQSIWDTSVRLAPAYHAYTIQAPFNEKISEVSFPIFASVPVLPQLSFDVGTAFATVHLENSATGTSSDMSGLTDTQIRANYSFGQDFLVLTGGVNIPTGSSTIDAGELAAATRIGSDFLTFPISGFGSGLGFTGGAAIARPLGAWNLGLGASVRQSSEYEPFRDEAGTATKYQPGPEYRARAGLDHPFGTGHVSVGFTFSKFGDDKSNAVTFNSGDRYITEFAMNNALNDRVDYSLVVWDLYRTSGTLINSSPSPSGNITNGLLTFGLRAGGVGIEPSIETRLWTQEGSNTSYLGTFGLRFFMDHGAWALVPGFGFSIGSMESAPLNGYRATLGLRLGGAH